MPFFGDAANSTVNDSALTDIRGDQNIYNYHYHGAVDQSSTAPSENESAQAKQRKAEVVVQKEVGPAHPKQQTQPSHSLTQILVGHIQVVNFYDIPPLQVRYFVTRNHILERLEKLFERSNVSSSAPIVVLLGMGGGGKTQLALEYCRRMKDSGDFRAIFWLDASSRNALYRAMDIIAKRLFPERVLDNPDVAVSLVRDVLSSWSDAWLMVFDNLDNPSDVHDIFKFFPDSRHGSILITSRHADSKEFGQTIELDCMEMEEGLQLLLRSRETDTEELAAAKQILTRLGRLPLAIDQARAYISKQQLSLKQFMGEFEKRKEIVMRETPRFWQYRRTLSDTEETSLSLLTTWEMSLPLLGVDEQHKKKLKDVLTLFAFFHPTSISESLFSRNNKDADLMTSPMSIFDDDGDWDHLAFESAVVHMRELSLLQFSRRGKNEIVASLHSMVSEWLRMRLDVASRSSIFTAAVSHLKIYLASTYHNDYTMWQEALLHTDALCQTMEDHTKSDWFVPACITFGGFYADHNRLVDAERMFNLALAGCEKLWGPEHISTLVMVNNLGNIYKDQCRLVDAEMMYDRALAGQEKTLGPEHTSTLDTVNNLGLLYSDQGHLVEAERMYDRGLAGQEKVLGPEHTSTLNTVNNLGILYAGQGRLVDAERMYDRALAGREKILGPKHTSTLNTINNLGILYVNQGRLVDAERMYNGALAGYEKALGPEHRSTLDTVNNLGLLYTDQGRLVEAERMYDRALAGKEKALGPEHSSTLRTVNNLGILYANQGRLVDAERVYNRALAGKEKALGPEHISTVRTMHNLGNLYADQGRLVDVERIYSRTLAAVGPDDAFTLHIKSKMRNLYNSQGHPENTEMA